MSVYRHFRSKEQLAAESLRAQIREAWERWDTTIAPLHANPRRQFEALFAAHLARDQTSHGCVLGNRAIQTADGDHVLVTLVRGFKREVRERLRMLAHELGAHDSGALGDALMLLLVGSDVTRLVFPQNEGPTASLMFAVNALIDAHLRTVPYGL